MRWTLFSVTSACAWRTVRRAFAATPLPVGMALCAVVAAPGAAVWLGARLSAPFAVAWAQPGFGQALALGVGVTAVVGGVSAALLAPGPAALGPQLAAAPQTRETLASGTVVAPVGAVGAVIAVVLGCFVLPLAGGTGATLVLLGACCASLGAALGEGVRLVAAAETAGAVVLAAVGLAWLAVGAVGGGSAYTGPVGLVVSAWGSPVLATGAAAGLLLWGAACGVRRRERVATREARLRRLPARAWAAIAVATARRVLRHRELRLHGVTAIVLPLAAAAGFRLALGVGGAAATVFCVAVTLTAVALYPPAGLGLMRRARWLLETAPRRRFGVVAGAVTGGVLAAAALVVASAVLAAPLGVPEPRVYLELEAVSAFVLGCAALAGALVPWRPDQALHQVASYAAVLAVVVAAWLIVGRLEGVVAGASAFGLAAGNAVLLLGVGAAAAVSR